VDVQICVLGVRDYVYGCDAVHRLLHQYCDDNVHDADSDRVAQCDIGGTQDQAGYGRIDHYNFARVPGIVDILETVLLVVVCGVEVCDAGLGDVVGVLGAVLSRKNVDDEV